MGGWDPGAWPMEWVPEHGAWVTKQVLADGDHAYKFVAGDQWIADPGNPSTVDDGFGGVNSLWVQACADASVAAVPSTEPAASFPVESRPTHFSYDNNAASAIVTSVHADQYDRAAQDLVKVARDHVDELAGCTSGDSCTEAFVTTFGRRAFRRPLTSVEVDRYTGLNSRQCASTWAPAGKGLWTSTATSTVAPSRVRSRMPTSWGATVGAWEHAASHNNMQAT